MYQLIPSNGGNNKNEEHKINFTTHRHISKLNLLKITITLFLKHEKSKHQNSSSQGTKGRTPCDVKNRQYKADVYTPTMEKSKILLCNDAMKSVGDRNSWFLGCPNKLLKIFNPPFLPFLGNPTMRLLNMLLK